ncbi:hypothetical protein EDC01DRAFT_642660 [Geopyxis carbonaria]|nr:hypothetical protein EDC01DRAFT_642660 [Geopyxis carbonaria]
MRAHESRARPYAVFADLWRLWMAVTLLMGIPLPTRCSGQTHGRSRCENLVVNAGCLIDFYGARAWGWGRGRNWGPCAVSCCVVLMFGRLFLQIADTHAMDR